MKAPAMLCATLEVALNRYLALEPEALAECGQLRGRVLALVADGPGWEFFLLPHAGGVQVLDAAPREPDVRITAPVTRLFAQALAAGAGEGAALSGTRVEGDAELLRRFSTLLAKVGFDPEEWLARWMGDAAAHRVHQGLRTLAGWARRSAGTLALDTAEYLREETGELPHRADVEDWMAGVERARERAEGLAARVARLERKR